MSPRSQLDVRFPLAPSACHRQAAASKAARKSSNIGASAASSFSAGMMIAIGEGIARILNTPPRNVEAGVFISAAVNFAVHDIK
jgi:hypothetical protein